MSTSPRTPCHLLGHDDDGARIEHEFRGGDRCVFCDWAACHCCGDAIPEPGLCMECIAADDAAVDEEIEDVTVETRTLSDAELLALLDSQAAA